MKEIFNDKFLRYHIFRLIRHQFISMRCCLLVYLMGPNPKYTRMKTTKNTVVYRKMEHIDKILLFYRLFPGQITWWILRLQKPDLDFMTRMQQWDCFTYIYAMENITHLTMIRAYFGYGWPKECGWHAFEILSDVNERYSDS